VTPHAGAFDDVSALDLARRSMSGDLPTQYRFPLEHEFDRRVARALRPGIHVLDVGSGRRPCVPGELRPRGAFYVGLDVSGDELAAAGGGSYDDRVVADVAGPVQLGLVDRFDLVVSFQVLEHVRPLDRALDNMRAYLRPGGRMIVQMSGAFTPFSLLGRVVPHGAKVRVLERFLDRDPVKVFPAHYDRCWASALRHLTADSWGEVEVVPLHRGAAYLHFSKPLRAAYLVYERSLARHGLDDLAAYYIVDAADPSRATGRNG
jgi:SAM-dependent methyltransferase